MALLIADCIECIANKQNQSSGYVPVGIVEKDLLLIQLALQSERTSRIRLPLAAQVELLLHDAFDLFVLDREAFEESLQVLFLRALLSTLLIQYCLELV